MSLCPAYQCVSAAQLIGIVNADGSVAFLGRPLPLNDQFVQIAAQGRPPELRFRFVHECAEGGCANWSGRRCEVAAQVSNSDRFPSPDLPRCGIRSECRWFSEQGPKACAVCATVVRGAE